MKNKNLRIIIVALIIIVISVSASATINFIEFYEPQSDIPETTMDYLEFVDRVNMEENLNYHDEQSQFKNYALLLRISYEVEGITYEKFDVGEYDFELYQIYNGILPDNSFKFYFIPIVDGKEVPLVYEYNLDNTLTLVWSAEE